MAVRYEENEKQLDLRMTDMRRNPYLQEYGRNREAGNRAPARKVMPAPVRPARKQPPTARPEGRERRERTERPEKTERPERRERRERTGRSGRIERPGRIRPGMAAASSLGALLIIVLTIVCLKTLIGDGRGLESVQSPNFEYIWGGGNKIQGLPERIFNEHPAWTEDYLTINEYSRPGEELKQVKNIFVHYTANKGTDAGQNRSYFEQLKDSGERSASAHFIIGYEGDIIQCIPLNEIAYAVKTRNYDSVSIECCYLDADGAFTQETYDSLITLLKWLTEAYNLEAEDILRHYDCGGKKCPLYYVEHPEEWERLKEDV